jgi:hypothetical protein
MISGGCMVVTREQQNGRWSEVEKEELYPCLEIEAHQGESFGLSARGACAVSSLMRHDLTMLPVTLSATGANLPRLPAKRIIDG